MAVSTIAAMVMALAGACQVSPSSPTRSESETASQAMMAIANEGNPGIF